MTIDSSSAYDDDFSSSDSLNSDRLNPSTRNKILDYLRISIKLFKRAAIMSDKILPNYMFSRDIEEFKNSKILKYLHQAFQVLEGLTERVRSSNVIEKNIMPSSSLKRISHTPEITSSPLLEPLKP